MGFALSVVPAMKLVLLHSQYNTVMLVIIIPVHTKSILSTTCISLPFETSWIYYEVTLSQLRMTTLVLYRVTGDLVRLLSKIKSKMACGQRSHWLIENSESQISDVNVGLVVSRRLLKFGRKVCLTEILQHKRPRDKG